MTPARDDSQPSPKALKQVLDLLDARALLKLIDYRPDKLEELEPGQFRGLCPIHKETIFRTLSVDGKAKTYDCSYNFCPGHGGGNLIDLYAKTRELGIGEAAKELVEKLGLVVVPDSHEETDSIKQLEIGYNLMELGACEEALAVYRPVVERDPFHVAAREGMAQAYRQMGDTSAAASELQVVAHVHQNAADWQRLAETAARLIELQPRDPDNRRLMIASLNHLGDQAMALRHQQSLVELLDGLGRAQEATEERIALEERGVISLESSRKIIEGLIEQGRGEEAVDQANVRMGRFAQGGDEQAILEILALMVGHGLATPGHLRRFFELVETFGLSPENLDACLAGAAALVKRGAHAEALELLDGIERGARGNAAYMKARAAALSAGGDREAARKTRFGFIDRLVHDEKFDEAETEIWAVLEENASDVEALRRLVDVREARGQEREAIETCWKIIDELRAQGREAELLPIYEKLTFFEPENAAARQNFILALAQGGRRREAGLAATMLAEELVEDGRAEEAVQRLSDLSDRLTGNAEILVKLGDLLDQAGQGPRAAEAYADAAEIRQGEGRPAVVLDLLRRAREADPNSLDIPKRLGEALAEQGKRAEAAEAFRELAELCLRRGDPALAEEAARKALKAAPDNPAALRALARVQSARQEEGKAIETLLRLAKSALEQESFDEAAEALQDALKLDPDNIGALELRVEALERSKQTAPAISAGFELADLLIGRGEAGRAVPVLRRLLAMDSASLPAREKLLAALLRDKNVEEAAQACLELVETCRRAGDPAKARRACDAVLEAAPGNIAVNEAALSLAREAGDSQAAAERAKALVALADQAGDSARALELRRLLAESDPGDLDHRRDLAAALRACGDPREAASETLALARALRDSESGAEEEAIQRYREALDIGALGQDDAEAARLEMGELQAGGGDAAAATASFIEIAERHRDNDEPEEAMAILQKAIDLDKRNPEPRRAMVDLCLEEQDIAGAVSGYITLRELYLSLGDHVQALDVVDEAIGVKPDNLSLREYRVEGLRALERHGEANEAAKQLAKLRAKHGDPARALEEIEALAQREDAPEGLDELRASVQAAIDGKPEGGDSADGPGPGSASDASEDDGGPKFSTAERKALSSADHGKTGGYRRVGPERDPVQLRIVEDYTFDNFVVGDENQFAYATAKAVSKSPGQQYNPLFIHGDVGVGKTHLMNALATAAIKGGGGEFAIIYTGTEEFISQLVEAIQTNSVTDFRAGYRSTDMLLIDDIQFLSGKERAQEEFFHVFNALFQANKQIVLTSDRPPREIEKLQERLTSRFGAGVIVDMQRPGIETRMAIVRSELERQDMNLDAEVVETIAQRVEGSVRDLKGAINQLRALAEISGQPIDAARASKAIDAIYSRSR